MTDLTEHLKTHTPSLLDPSQWPMSKGPWSVRSHELTTQPTCWSHQIRNKSFLAQVNSGDDARYIAALSPDSLVPELWDAYETILFCSTGGFTVKILDALEKQSLRYLTLLDAMQVILWTPRA